MDNLDLKPCPFCGGEVRITVCDDEGNPHTDEYEDDAWSGLGYMLHHDIKCEGASDCPIAGHEGEGELGTFIYYTREDAAEAWNKRASGWIPCSERMPPTGTRVYVREGDFTAIGFFGKYTQRWIEPISGAHLDNVSHWMPLPEPPEDVE